MSKTCPKCKNSVFDKQGVCKYCAWKGDARAGLLLKNMIKEINEKIREGERHE